MQAINITFTEYEGFDGVGVEPEKRYEIFTPSKEFEWSLDMRKLYDQLLSICNEACETAKAKLNAAPQQETTT
ncbi:MAG TPA: hypothetical protein VF077_13140 [Nitrospiraceae bacterium]